ncbi:hypothetical protein ACFE04_018703 [Oxalis oulophora]
MQRYRAAVDNSPICSSSARDSARTDSSLQRANFPLNSRRASGLTPYKLKCDKESLNSRLGPADFLPQTSTCPEETLTREYVQSGYSVTAEGLEDAREIQAFNKPAVLRCREAIRKCHRAINESRVQKRKAGQVYDVPLSGSLLTKHALYPEQRPCSEDFRKKWIEKKRRIGHSLLVTPLAVSLSGYLGTCQGLSQPHKSLRSLAEHVPHGYRKKSLFEVIIKNNVPLPRATWFIKVTYLNLVRPGSVSISSGTPDETQLSRSELWTKDVIEYLQVLLDRRSDSSSGVVDGEEPSLHFKWGYVARLVQWHLAEGVLLPSLIIDWEKELLEILQFLLPIIYGLLETIVLCQTYVRNLVGISLRFIREPSPSGSNLVDNSRRAYTTSVLVEMLRYLILAVPDTFVALDCFPLPQSVLSYTVNDGNFASKISEDAGKIKSNSEVITTFKIKGIDAQYQTLSFNHVVSTVQKRADKLSKNATPGFPGQSVAKAILELDKALLQGDVREAYVRIFEDLCDGPVSENWMSEVSPCLRSSLKWIGSVKSSFVCSVFFICEWATCDFRDFRTAQPNDVKFTGRKDFSQHEMNKGGVQLFVSELVRAGIFYPQAYVRQLIIGGTVDKHGPVTDIERRKRHHQVLKHLPGQFMRETLEEANVADSAQLLQAMHVYKNERRFVLRELLPDQCKNVNNGAITVRKRKHYSNSSRKMQSLSNPSSSKKSSHLDFENLKVSISVLLQLPSASSIVTDTLMDESQCFKRQDLMEVTPGCEDCKIAKRQKLNDEGTLPALSDNDDNWWVKKGATPLEPVIENSQGASTSHVCDNKVICPHHKADGENLNVHSGDIISVGKALKQLWFTEKRTITIWLTTKTRQLVESLLMIKSLTSGSLTLSAPSSTIHNGRNMLLLPRSAENHVCEVGEAFLLASLCRYENILIATNLIPEASCVTMRRAAAVMASNGRISGSASLAYARYLLKKYDNAAIVVDWEKNFKCKCDKRLLSELGSGWSLKGDVGIILGVPAGFANLDDYLRQKMSGGRISRVGISMKDVVQRHIDEAFRQIGGAAQEGDLSLVSCAVSGNVGPTITTALDFPAGGNFSNHTFCVNLARFILRVHVTCLCLLKEALGDRQARVFEIALGIEDSTCIASIFVPGKISRGHDSNTSMSNDVLNNSAKLANVKSSKTIAGVSDIIGAVIHGVTGLERLLVGNCRTISVGLVVELLGEPSIIALSRMQRLLPIYLVFPPAYSFFFAFVIWKPFIVNSHLSAREEIYQSLTIVIDDAIKHLPFRGRVSEI